jgi:6-pyruvoyltetrahydropterin/6-carboxytetrahydropterin synthase
MYYLTIEDHFSSAHQLRGYHGKCENLHGHNWRVVLTVKGKVLNDIGILIDFHDLKSILGEITQTLDHLNLNDLDHFAHENPSSENIARYIFCQTDLLLKSRGYSDIHTDSITVYESDTARCTYREDTADS